VSRLLLYGLDDGRFDDIIRRIGVAIHQIAKVPHEPLKQQTAPNSEQNE
jgi:hypothetical protein